MNVVLLDVIKCSLFLFVAQTNWSLKHFYVFQPFCKSVEPVCGHNGETYSSVCAAYSDRVAVDYHGHCQAVGVLSDYSFHTECAFVKCPQLSATACKPVIAPGMLIHCWSSLQIGESLQATCINMCIFGTKLML